MKHWLNSNSSATAAHASAFSLKRIVIAGLAAASLSMLVWAVAPPANSVIGNQATATYTDAAGTTRTSTSNLVQTTVQQVNSFTLTAGATKSVAPGGTVYFPHTITNNGNGADTYNLSIAPTGTPAVAPVLCTGGSAVSPTPAGCNTFLYPDADGDGVPDSTAFLTNLTTPMIAAGGTYKFVMAFNWPAATTTGSDSIIITATSNNTGAGPALTAQTNTDIINVTLNAVINVTKSLSVTTGAKSLSTCVPPYGTVLAPSAGCVNTKVTLTYTNTGGSSADVTLTDALSVALTPNASMRYVAGSGLWSGCGTTALTDATGAEAAVCGTNITYNYTGTTVTAVILNVAPGQSGTISFDVNIADTAAVGVSTTSNTASFTHTNGGATAVNTNTAAYTVGASAGVVANNKLTASTNVAGATDNEVSVAIANQGAVLWFKNVIWNTGTGTDTFDMSQTSSTFPAGTGITFYSDTSNGSSTDASGATVPTTLGSPLTDSNGNGTVDTGPMAAGAKKIVWTRVALLPNTTGGSYNIVKRATSTVNPALNDEVADVLTAITPRTVDLGNAAIAGVSATTGTNANGVFSQATAPANAATTNTNVLPGSSTRFTLTVTPGALPAGQSDNYNLTTWADFASANGTAATPAPFTAFPVAFYAGACPVAGTIIASTSIVNTGNISVATSYCAEVAIPVNATAATTNLFFRAQSPSSAQMTAPYASWDVKQDAITVASTSAVSISPPRTGTVFPGGNVTYTHQVCNVGNTAAAVSLGSVNNNGFTSGLWIDTNNNGNVDAGDTPYPTSPATQTIAANTCLNLINNVTAPAGAAPGTTNVTTITASVGGTAVGTVTDTTTVVTGDVALVKEQREVTCAGGGAGVAVAGGNAAWTTNNLPVRVLPGACLQYRITGTNTGATNATNLIIADASPNFTTFSTAACAATANTGTVATTTNPATIVALSTGAIGTVSVATVLPGATVQLIFCVKVDN